MGVVGGYYTYWLCLTEFTENQGLIRLKLWTYIHGWICGKGLNFSAFRTLYIRGWSPFIFWVSEIMAVALTVIHCFYWEIKNSSTVPSGTCNTHPGFLFLRDGGGEQAWERLVLINIQGVIDYDLMTLEYFFVSFFDGRRRESKKQKTKERGKGWGRGVFWNLLPFGHAWTSKHLHLTDILRKWGRNSMLSWLSARLRKEEASGSKELK